MLFKSFGSDFDYLKQYHDDEPFDELFELYVGITSLVAAANSIGESGKPQDCETQLWSCQAHKKRALAWYSRNIRDIGPITCSANKLKDLKALLPPVDDLFGHFYSFDSLQQAELHVFFWKAMIIIQLMIYRAQVLFFQHSRPAEDIPADPRAYRECMLAGDYADQICRAIPYFLQNGMGSYGILKITVNLPYIFKPYTHLRCREKFFWLQKICQSVVGDGNDLASCHSQVWWKYWLLCEAPMMNYICSLGFKEDYTERYHVSVEGDLVKVIKVIKDGAAYAASEPGKIPASTEGMAV